MTNIDLGKWVDLLAQVEIQPQVELNSTAGNIPNYSLNVSNLEDLNEYESRISMPFPSGYKEFCTVFGKGFFGDDWIRIDCPKLNNIEAEMISNKDILETYCLYEIFFEIQPMLEAAYILGDANQSTFILDIRSYSTADRSYDIYGISYNGYVCKVGRDFFNFVVECCLGDKIPMQFPNLAQDMLSSEDRTLEEVLVPSFTPIPW